MPSSRQFLLRETGGNGFHKAQQLAFALRSASHNADFGSIPSKAGSWADDAYITTDAPLSMVRRLAKPISATIRERIPKTIRGTRSTNPNVITFMANPPKIAAAVQAILYRHADDGQEYVHVFGGREPELREFDGGEWLRVDRLPLKTDVVLVAAGDDLVLRHTKGKPLSQEF